MSSASVGGEVESWCTTCKIMKDHVVVAVVDDKPAKVECLGCHGQHRFRATPPGTPAPRAARTARKTPVPAAGHIDDLEAKLSAGTAGARGYATGETYAVGDFVRHPTFGVGLVFALPAAQKVEIAFLSGRKLLVHARTGEMITTLERPPRRDDEAPRLATDAPPPKPE